MQGCRPLNREERRAVLAHATPREAALLAIGFCTGFRISELLSLTVGAVIDPNGRPLARVSVQAGNTKTKVGRTVVLNADAQKAAARWTKGRDRTEPLFPSRKGGGKRAIGRIQAWRLLKEVFALAGVYGQTGTHSLRKTFAAECYRLLNGAIEKVRVALGHKSITSTICYLSFATAEVDSAILGIEL